MTISVRTSVSGAPAVAGSVTIVAGDTVDLSLESYSGVRVIEWEVFAYPEGWTPPAGWTAGSGRYFWNGSSGTSLTPPQLDFTAAPWGKWLFRATVNYGLGAGGASDLRATRDDTVGVEILGPGGLEDPAVGEEQQFDDWRQQVGSIQGNFRKLATGTYSVLAFGADPTGATDSTAAIQEAIDAAAASGGAIVYIPPGTYSVTGITLASRVSVVGAGMGVTIIDLAASSDAPVLFGTSVTDLVVRDLSVYGNKSAQTAGTSGARGVYFLDECERVNLERVEVVGALDHGIFFSGGGASYKCGRGGAVHGCRVYNCGTAAHSAAGGAGGTGILPGYATCSQCHSGGNQLNGYKGGQGQFAQCIAEDNVGGGFETGFATPEVVDATFLGCHAIGGNGGFRHQGQGDNIVMVGCSASGTATSGCTFLNGVRNASLDGCRFYNNGTSGVRPATGGLDGVTLIAGAGGAPTAISLVGCQLYDDQGSPTQEYGIYCEGSAAGVIGLDVDGSNVAFGNTKGAVYISDRTDDIVIRGFQGYSGRHRDATPVVFTGTAGTSDLVVHSVRAKECHVGTCITVRVAGYCTGTAGSKVVRLHLGGSAYVIASESAVDQQGWCAVATLTLMSTTHWSIVIASGEEGGTSWVTAARIGVSSGTDIEIKCSGTLGDAGDTIAQTALIITTEA